ncbi:MAG: metal-dependent transcriptional regulator [Thermoplasmata archaeon]
MDDCELTTRDKEYLRALFLLEAYKHPIGPAEVAKMMNVSRVAVLKKMRRLEYMGYGDYVSRKGLLINQRSVNLIQRDVRKHHLLEKFLETTLDMESEEACDESAVLDVSVSNNLLEKMDSKYGEDLHCDCGCCISTYYEPEDLYDCHWYQKQFSIGINR